MHSHGSILPHHAWLHTGLPFCNRTVNRELVLLYWQIGRDILRRQGEQGWGSKVIDRLATDLRRAFPGMSGFSKRNLQYMRAFAQSYPEEQIVHQLGAQIPWRHNVYLLDAVKDPTERDWYTRKTVENGWSRAVLMHQVETGLYHRQGKAPDNFTHVLPSPDSNLTRELIKDPYNFDFLMLSERAQERDLQRGLLEHIREFLLELGKGFAYVGSEYKLEVEGREYRIDWLFYHLHLRRFVVIELKPGEFEPEYAGKMNFYLSAVDDQLRHPSDEPSIGIILCKSRNRLIAEYALRDLSKPISVSEFMWTLWASAFCGVESKPCLSIPQPQTHGLSDILGMSGMLPQNALIEVYGARTTGIRTFVPEY